MKQLTIEAFKAMLDNALKQIKAREEEFSKLDGCIFCNTRKDKQENHCRYDREKERINMNIPETITCF